MRLDDATLEGVARRAYSGESGLGMAATPCACRTALAESAEEGGIRIPRRGNRSAAGAAVHERTIALHLRSDPTDATGSEFGRCSRPVRTVVLRRVHARETRSVLTSK